MSTKKTLSESKTNADKTFIFIYFLFFSYRIEDDLPQTMATKNAEVKAKPTPTRPFYLTVFFLIFPS